MMHHHTKFNWYCPDKHSLKFLTFAVTLTFSQDIPSYEHALSNYVGHNKISSSEHIIKIVISLYEPKLSYCDLDLQDSNPFLHMTLWLIMMCYNTGFGYKRFSDSEDIIQSNINWNV